MPKKWMKIFIDKKVYIRLLSSVIYFVLICSEANAVMSRQNMPTNVELEKLPRWCQTQILAAPRLFHGDKTSVPDSIIAERAELARKMGIDDIMIYTHHYAYGLNWLNRYRNTFSQSYRGVESDRKFAIKTAIDQFLFMDKYIKPTHKIYGEYQMNLAYAYAQNEEYNKSFDRYKILISNKPKFVRPYFEYANLLNSLGYNKAAIDVLNHGIKNTNDEGLKKVLSIITKSSK